MMNECDCTNHGICDEPLYTLHGAEFVRCHRHIVLHDLWCIAPICDLFDFLDTLDGDTARTMYELHREAVPLDYWEQLNE